MVHNGLTIKRLEEELASAKGIVGDKARVYFRDPDYVVTPIERLEIIQEPGCDELIVVLEW